MSNAPRPLFAAFRPEELRPMELPVVAFAGRSNVGKSSLLNRLLGIRSARVSKTPGRTEGIFFYRAEKWIAADLPGFGFARRPREARRGWAILMEAFLSSGIPLLTVHLLDPTIRTSELDLDFRDYLRELHLPILHVATKADRLTRAERLRAARRLEADFGAVRFLSSKPGDGLRELKNAIDQAVAQGTAALGG